MENQKLTPLFFFLSLGTVVSLIVSVSALLNLSFETLNHAFPDVLSDIYAYGYANYSFDAVRSALALIIIVFPIYVILEHFWSKAASSIDLSVWNATLRRWAIYIILFLVSITIIADLVILVRYFVSGEITTRFILKVVLTLVISGITGWYYICKLKNQKKYVWFTIGSSALVLSMIIYSFTVIGSPVSQRNQRLDQRRIEDLQSIQWQVINYWQQKEKLPETLIELHDPISNTTVAKDPEFQLGAVYEYQKTAKFTFELCATFALPIPEGFVPGDNGSKFPMQPTRDSAMSSVASYPGGPGESWDHEAGRTCYGRTIDPELYPPYPKEKQ